MQKLTESIKDRLVAITSLAPDVLKDSWLLKLCLDAIIKEAVEASIHSSFTYEVIQVPADWRQAVKDRWFPKWAKGRWPVKLTTYYARAYCPHTIGTDEEHLQFLADPRSYLYSIASDGHLRRLDGLDSARLGGLSANGGGNPEG